MKCPIDGSELQMTERRGVEIDYCPQCRGVWLDRGELDKMIGGARQSFERSREEYESEKHDERGPSHRGNRKEGFLGDLFDF